MMYTAATHLVETLTKKPYPEFLKEKLWDPLGMTNTYHDFCGVDDSGTQEHVSAGYAWDTKKGEYVSKTLRSEPEGQGAGCIISCAEDYIKWVSSFLKGTGPLSDESRKEMATGRSIIHYSDDDDLPFYGLSAYGLGLYTESYRGHKIVGHSGSVFGFESLMRWLPQHNWGIYVIGNSNGAGWASVVLFHWLMDRLLGVREEDRIDWFTHCKKIKDKEEEEAEDPPEWEVELRKQDKVELGIPLEKVAGRYHDPGYKDMVIEFKDNKLVADCSDRCMGLLMDFEHISGNVFVAVERDPEEVFTSRSKTEVAIENGVVERLGLEFESALKGKLIWFQRVD
jgi:hypothetical protein